MEPNEDNDSATKEAEDPGPADSPLIGAENVPGSAPGDVQGIGQGVFTLTWSQSA